MKWYTWLIAFLAAWFAFFNPATAQTVQYVTSTEIGGIPTVGMTTTFTTGRTIFVDSNKGTSGGDGSTPAAAVDTLAHALLLATANKGDVILLMPDHAETIVAATTISTEGITIKSLGVGDNRAQFTFGTSTGANFAISADNVRLEGLIFKNDIDSQAAVVTTSNAYTQIVDCDFFEGSGKQYLIGVSLANAAANYCTIDNCRFVSITAGAASAIKIAAAVDRCTIKNCYIKGDWSDAGIYNPTGNIATHLDINNNYVENLQAGSHAIKLVSACTGTIRNNTLMTDAGADVDPGACNMNGVFVPGLGYKCVKTEDVNTATADDLFIVTGKVLITCWTGEVTNALGAAVTDYKLRVKTSNRDLCATSNIASAAIGFMFQMNGDAGDDLLNTATATETCDTNGKGMANRFVGKSGSSLTLQSSRTAGDSGDAIVHSLWYIPLEAGAEVVAAP